MKLFEILSTLTEGGMAIKGVSPITQKEVNEYSPDLLDKICKELKLSKLKVKMIGSAGNKLKPTDLSGDIDIAVECSSELVEKHISKLAGDNQFKIMKGIGVYSFAYNVDKKLVQVDLMPVNNINFATWSFQAHINDLADGLKGAHRNEIFFAIASNMPRKVLKTDEEGNPVIIERYFYDLSRGLMIGTQSRINNKGKITKNFSTVEKKVLSDDPNKIVKLMFGDHVNYRDVETFDSTLRAILYDYFIHKEEIENILNQTTKGIKNKNLEIPLESKYKIKRRLNS